MKKLTSPYDPLHPMDSRYNVAKLQQTQDGGAAARRRPLANTGEKRYRLHYKARARRPRCIIKRRFYLLRCEAVSRV
jgi:hypothetical protein